MSTLTAPSASRPLSLRVNFSWTFAGNMAYALSQWGIIMVLARFGDPAMVGLYGLGIALSSPVLAVAMLQLRSVQVTDARGEFPFADYFGTRIAAMVAAALAIIALALFRADDRYALAVLLLIGLAKVLESVSEILRGLFQRHERMDFSGTSLILKGLLVMFIMPAVLWYTGDLILAVSSLGVVYLLTFVFYDLLQARRVMDGLPPANGEFRRLRPRFHWRTIARLFWVALPLGLVMGLITLQTSIPRLVLEASSGTAVLGFFVAIVYPMQAGQMVITALGQSAAPRLARSYVEDRKAYRRLLNKLVLVSAALAAAIIVCTLLIGRPMLRFLYGAAYSEYYREFFIIALAASIQLFSSAWGYALTSARRFSLQVLLTGASCAVTVIACFAMIPQWHITGAALAILANAIVSAGLFFLAVRVVACSTLPLSRHDALVELAAHSDSQPAG